MLTASVGYSRDGYRLTITEVPTWAHVVEDATQALCALLRHPFCEGRWPIGPRLGQRLLSPASRREKARWSVPLTDEQVHRAFPEWVLDLDG